MRVETLDMRVTSLPTIIYLFIFIIIIFYYDFNYCSTLWNAVDLVPRRHMIAELPTIILLLRHFLR